MNKIIKNNLIFLAIFIIFGSKLMAADVILPLPKPSVDEEVKIKTAKKKEIYPKKKPIKFQNETTNLINEEKTNISLETNEEIYIYPKKKPILVSEKINKVLDKSVVLSKKDFKIAKRVFEEINNKKWLKAIKLSKKAKNKILYNLVNYIYLKQANNAASFNDYKTFINENPNYPRISRLRYLAEHKINLKNNSPISLIKWFDGKEPLSEFGKIKLGEVYISQGNIEMGEKLIKDGWIKAKLTKYDLKYLRQKYKKIITVADNINRVDWHAWEGKHWDVQRMLRYLPKDETALYRARQLLMSKSYGVDNAISKIPNKYKNDIGLKYDRLKWRRRRGRLDASLEILFDLPNGPEKLVRPDRWWVERSIISRSLIYKKKYAKAYKVSSNHSISEGVEFAEAEWLSGWIALTFLNDENLALGHFKNFYKNVSYPISLSRGAYWIARTYKKLNNKKKSDEWFTEASRFVNSYYGQLAFVEINQNKDFKLNENKNIDKKFKIKFNKNPLVNTIILL